MRKGLRRMFIFLFSAQLAFGGSVSDVAAAALGMEEEVFLGEIPVVIGVSKHQESIRTTPLATYVVSREELNRWGIQQQYEIFGRVPGFSFYDFDFFGNEGVPVR